MLTIPKVPHAGPAQSAYRDLAFTTTRTTRYGTVARKLLFRAPVSPERFPDPVELGCSFVLLEPPSFTPKQSECPHQDSLMYSLLDKPAGADQVHA